MDPYAAAAAAATSVPPPASSHIQQDPYIYSQQPQYDPSQQQHYTYYDYSQTYPNPNPDPNAALYQTPVEQPQQEQQPIHPPGVPVQNDPNYAAAYYAPTHYQADPNYYYPQQPQQPQPQPQQLGYTDPNMVHQDPQQWQQPLHPGQPADYGLTSMYPPPNAQGGQLSGPARGGGRGGSRGSGRSGSRGGGRGFRGGGSSFRGGRGGGGRGGNPRIKTEPKPQFLAFCELCRVDCNTHEVLENHLSGKKHKKNVEIQEELKKLAAKTHAAQLAAAAAYESQKVKLESQPFQSAEQGLKRKTRDGEVRASADSEKKQKEVVPFICELCDVKCESAPNFDCHLKGRKHMFNLQRFQEQQAQAELGQVAIQALFPALEAALYPALQALAQNASTSHGYGGGIDQSALIQLLQPYLSQTGPGVFPQGPGFQPTPQSFNPVGNQVEPVTESEPKTEVAVEPDSKNEDQVETESKTEQNDSVAADPTQ